MRPEQLLCATPVGLYCARGRFHIDPLQPVERALITHAHADHARPGHTEVMATAQTLALMRIRYGDNFAHTSQSIAYGETVWLDGVGVTFHPAGHVLGSAQILVQHGGLRMVASGDYKNVRDPTCVPFELVRCDVFITEATFGLPVFRHGDPAKEIGKLLRSIATFPDRAHVIGAYSIGKSQRLLALLRESAYDRPIYLHGALEAVTRYYVDQGIDVGDVRPVRGHSKSDLTGAVALCPPSALRDRWVRGFSDPVTAFASGWMRVRARARQQGATLPLVISDHADWDDLTATIAATGAPQIWVTHGQEDGLVRWCELHGLAAQPLRIVGYGEEDDGAGLAGDPTSPSDPDPAGDR